MEAAYVLGVDKEELPALTKEMSRIIDWLTKESSHVVFSFNGWDSDPREIYQIPECRQWLHMALSKHPKLLCRLELHYQLARMCTCEVLQTVKLGIRTAPVYQLSDEWLGYCAAAGTDPYRGVSV